jgi:hypothetical protein
METTTKKKKGASWPGNRRLGFAAVDERRK